jgi:hypothetical protein
VRCGKKFSHSEVRYPVGPDDEEVFACGDCFPEVRREYDDWRKLAG